MKLYSWNVNGVRAAVRKGLAQWIETEQPDILCLQETKAAPEQVPAALRELPGYESAFLLGERKGYSGVGLFTRARPQCWIRGLGEYRFDREGRLLGVDYGRFVLLNTYFPNGKASKERLQYKLEFYEAYLNYLLKLRKEGRSVVICGDVNTAHTELDLARPKANEKTSGFLPEERAWLDELVASGFVDTFRMFENAGGHYSWWDMKTRARERNVGWRLDYFFVSGDLKPLVKRAWILSEVPGSDHCPIALELDVKLEE